jgi:raffinose/stachyose/melibiose transport system permease protein
MTATIQDARPLRRAGDARRWTFDRIAVHLTLILFAALALGPIAVVILNSLKTTPAIFGGPFALPSADSFSLDGYRRVLTRGNFLLNYRNSLIVTTASVGLTVALSTLAAYALVEYRIRIVPLLSALFVVGVMLPIRLGTIPIIQIMVAWALMDTLVALILVYTAMSIPIAVTLMMTYFRTVPTELKEAARVDGASELRTFRIALPLVRPGLAAVATVTMLPIWNDLWFPLILAPGKANQTVTLGVQQFVGQFLNDYPALLAALTLGAVPLVVLFTVFSRQFIKGVSQGFSK